MFKSQDLWDLVESGYANPNEENRLKENKKKDANALFFIQRAVYDTIFSRISIATTTKEAWETLKKEFQGSTKVITVKLQSLRLNFKTLFMKSNEIVQEFLSRVIEIVSQMRSYGEKLNDQTVVEKVLRRLTPKFDYVVAAIEESKDLSVFLFDELIGYLHAHDARFSILFDKIKEKAFQVKRDTTSYDNDSRNVVNRGGYCCRGRGRGRSNGRNGQADRGQSSNKKSYNKSNI